MVRIVVVADTHRTHGQDLPEELTRELLKADLIVHLGDFVGPDVADFLEARAAFLAVHGNCDPPSIAARYPEVRRLNVSGHRIAALHGHVGGRTADEAARAVTDADVVLYGHSHLPRIVRERGRLLFNPGSPTERRFAAYRSFGILDVDDAVRPSIVPVE